MDLAIGTSGRFERLGVYALAVCLWLVLVLLSLVQNYDSIVTLHYPDADDAMRLVQVRDLMAGQDWFDIRQYRVNPVEGGGRMHWSRFVDASIAALILLLQPLLGEAAGERWAIVLYPPLLMLPLFLLLVRNLGALGDRRLVVAGLLVAFTGATFLHFFAPMRIDHHGWQLLLSLAMVPIALRRPSFANGLIGAAIITLYVEISLEGLPSLALFGGLFAFDWLRDPQTSPRLRGYAFGLVGFPALWLLAMRGPSSTLTVFCDTFSLPYAVAVAASAAVVGLWTLAPPRFWQSLPRRLLALGTAGAAGAVAFVLSGPQCLAGPFGALDPLVRRQWYDLVSEGLPIWAHKGTYGIIYLVPTLVGLAALVYAWRRSRGGPFAESWTRVAVIILANALMSALVTRMGATTHALMIPAFAAMALGLWDWSRSRRLVAGRTASVLLVCIASPGVDAALGLTLADAMGIGATSGEKPSEASLVVCPNISSVAALARQPTTRLFAPVDIGPALLAYTPHSVVATGHHRNNRAMYRVISAFLAEPAAAEPIVRGDRPRYLVICRDLNEVRRFAAAAPHGLAAKLERRKPVRWLERDADLSSGTLDVYRVLPPSGQAAATEIHQNGDNVSFH